MNGKDVIGECLTTFEPMTAVVPVGNIHIGKLPADIDLPNLLIRKISGVDYQTLAQSSRQRVTWRLQVTVRARTDEERDQILALAKLACAGRFGTIAGLDEVSVLSGGEGPDFDDDDASIFMGSHDFMASYLVAA